MSREDESMNAVSKPDYRSTGPGSNLRVSYRRIVEQCELAFFIIGHDGRIKHSSTPAVDLLKCTSRDVLNRFPLGLVHPDDQEIVAFELRKLSNPSSALSSIECRLSRADESFVHVQLQASAIEDEDERPATMLLVTDISEQKKLERSLVETRRKLASRDGFLHSILTSTSSLILTLDRSAHITFLNEPAIDCLESTFAELVGESLFSLIDPDSVAETRRAFLDTLNNGEIHQGLQMKIRIGGREKTIGFNLTPFRGGGREERVVLIGGDISERLAMEARVVQNGKMATLGEMATGVAHEINQPLNVIRLAAEMLCEASQQKESTDPYARLVEERSQKIVNMVDRAARIIGHLKTFGRQESSLDDLVSICDPINQALELAQDRLKTDGIVVHRHLDENLGKIRGDANSLEQVFLNLILNAADAMRGRPEKLITIIAFQSATDDRICVLFSDNGPGIPEGIRDRIFNPFFTTKEVGKGTGLGMSISYGIVQSHDASINVLPSENGALFRLEFPAGVKR